MTRLPALFVTLAISLTGVAAANPHPGPRSLPPTPRAAVVTRTAPPQRPPSEPRPAASTAFHGRRFIQALGALNLSGEQRERIRSLVSSTRDANQNVDPETRRQNVARMRQNIWGTLTPEQQSQFRNELNKQPAGDSLDPP